MWTTIKAFKDIKLEKTDDGVAKITINRPEVRNAFRPLTVKEMLQAFDIVHEDPSVGVIILCGEGPLAFCSGGDQKVRGHAGYVGDDGVPRLNILDVQKKIRGLPKPVVAMVAGYAIGGGHVLHVVCDLTIAADNAKFGQTGPKVGSFDGGLGSSYLARIVGQKKAREIWYLCRQYDAQQALDMGLVNAVVPVADLEAGLWDFAQVEIMIVSAIALSIAGMVLAFIPIIGWLAVLAAWLGFLVLWVMGLIAAASGELKPVPVLGAHYQKWFAGAFT